jgi:diguanylate cyclase (GGDEF)-like protein
MTYRSRAASLNGLAADISLIDPDQPVAVAAADLDGFGSFNEAHGTEAGDAVLAAFERSLTEHLPPGALVAHIRGDEFAVALPDMTCEEALLALEPIRAGFARAEPSPGHPDRVGASFGIAGRPAHGSTAEELLEAADAALVRAKRAGGNRIAIHVDELMILKSSYYPRPALHRLTKLSRRTGRPEASLLREALDDCLERNRELL